MTILHVNFVRHDYSSTYWKNLAFNILNKNQERLKVSEFLLSLKKLRKENQDRIKEIIKMTAKINVMEKASEMIKPKLTSLLERLKK